MDFCSYNIRGLNNKISFARDFISNFNFGLIALLETHVKQELANSISFSIAPRFRWFFNYDSHYNGRIWLGWDPNLWDVRILASNAQHVSCSVTKIGSNKSFFASFIYAFNTAVDRRQLWSGVLDFHSSNLSNSEAPWALLGDFNVCLHGSEIEGGSEALERIHKPFQVFQHVINSPDFSAIVSDAWNFAVEGDPWYVVSTKLKRVKIALKGLNREKGNLHTLVDEARTNLKNFQNALPDCPSSDQLLEEAGYCAALSLALHNEEVFLRQKSRVNWLKAGDNNNRFFFNSCKSRWNVNKLLALEDEHGEVFTSHKDISMLAVNYFSNLLGKSSNVTPFDSSVPLVQLSELDRSNLITPFPLEEILLTFKRMAKNKSPGPDGFTAEFFVAAWNIVASDISMAILHFFQTMLLPRSINATAIALIPKYEGASNITHFRPISCCNTIYKCISKMLASRLKGIMPSIISLNQSAFIPGRRMGDNIMLAQSLCTDYHKQSGTPRCAIKLDIRKAFDSLSWDFLFLLCKLWASRRFL
ncbi:uncharacterized protein LOC141705634 [Apium graveolens]|uniref:uncharacterized protein LOC141705634 n=1 Tax=Apium graveolens TaxID=4045 RepID=UPI003D7965EB